MAANVNNYIAAGNAAVKNSYAALAAARDNSPKYDEIAKAGMKARAEQKITAMKADADVKKTQVQANSYLKRNEIKLDKEKSLRKSGRKQQFAGKIAAAGAIMATGLIPGAEIIKQKRTDYSGMKSALEQNRQSTLAGIERAQEQLDAFENRPRPEPILSGSGSGTTTASASGGNTTSTANFVNTNITSSDRDILNLLGRYESGASGYDAVNQIGIKGGHGTLGHSGSIRNMQQHGGRSLTDFTVGEIIDLQNNTGANRQLSDQQWINAGRLHAVGRYQFIGPTFESAVQRQGVSRDAKFTPELQDQMALSHLRGAGSLQPWVGPSTHATAEERAMAANWFANQ